MKINYILLFLIVAPAFSASSQNQWAFMDGDKSSYISGVYDGANPHPGSRAGASTWTDNQGNFWLFGGNGVDEAGQTSLLNDLWMYNSTSGNWTFKSGSRTVDAIGDYLLQPHPGARKNAVSWTDNQGNFWLFGGEGYGIDIGNPGFLNDLWRYSSATETWTSFSGLVLNPINQPASYGLLELFQRPGSLVNATAWADGSGNLWMFGGYGYATTTDLGDLNDVWSYNISSGQWSWVNGSKGINALGVYGEKGIAASGHVPRARSGSIAWKDNTGNFWLYGGIIGGGNFDQMFSDLWRYNFSAGQWTWVSGSDTTDKIPFSIGQGLPMSFNNPGSRAYATGWTDSQNNLWMFGGYSQTAEFFRDVVDNVWKYSVASNEWTHVKGDLFFGNTPVYGTDGLPAAANTPGGVYSMSGWKDNQGNFWFFGGQNNSQELLDRTWKLVLCTQSITVSPSNGSFCNSVNSILLQATGTGPFTWFRDGEPINGAPSGNQYTALTGGIYHARSTSGGCEVFSNAAVLQTATIKPGLSGTGIFCEGQQISIGIPQTQFGQNYKWRKTQESFNTVYKDVDGNGDNQSLEFSEAEDDDEGDYYVISTKPGCQDISSDTVIVRIAKVENLQTTQVTANSVSFKWDTIVVPGAIDLPDYEYYVDESEDAEFGSGQFTGGAYSGLVGDLTANTQYYLHVRPACSTSNGDWVTIAFKTCGAAVTGTLTPATAEICSGETTVLTATGGTSYKWFRNGTEIENETGATYTANSEGTYSVEINNDGCGGSAPNDAVITILPRPSGTITPTAVSLCQDATQVLTATGGDSYEWYRNGTLLAGETTASITVSEAGSYSVMIKAGTCSASASDTAIVEVITEPTGTISPATATICQGSTQILTATGGISYVWKLDGTVIDGETAATISVGQQGTYSVDIVNGNCSGPAVNTAVVTVSTIPSGTITPTAVSLCQDATQVLTATGGDSYEWYRNGTLLAGETTASITVSEAGSYSVMIKAGTCSVSASDTAIVEVITEPTGTISPATATICEGSTQTLTATGGISYVWKLNGIIIDGETAATISVNRGGTYSVDLINGNCSGPAANTTVVTVSTTPAGSITPSSATICEGQTQILTAVGGTSFQWLRDGDEIEGAINSTLTVSEAGSYSVHITNDGCSGTTDPAIITVSSGGGGERYPDVIATANTPVQLQAREIGTTYSWEPLFGIDDPASRTPTVTINTETQYLVRITNQQGCQITDTVLVKVPSAVSKVVVPSAFTPNRNGVNDALRPLGDIQTVDFKVYNRWGTLVFQTNRVGEGWDGTYKGVPQQGNEAYRWVLSCTTTDGQTITKTGKTVLIR